MNLVERLTVLGAVVMMVVPSLTSAQDLPSRVTRRAVRAAVKITVQAEGGGPGQPRSSTGSGSIIDARGYILTNFHVVGNTTPGMGAPGTLYNANNEVRIAMVDNHREAAQTRYIGRVVRANARLDLALIRIMTDIHGAPIPRAQRFPTIQLGTTTGLRPGSRLFAFGFPLGVHTINVTSGEMSGFQMNSRDEVAWIRTDAEFNPGNSGGMLLDRRGRLIAIPTAVMSGRGTLEPIELARPVERVPEAWTRALRGRGHIDDVQIDGVPELPMGAYQDEAVGDGSSFDRPEMHYYRLPAQRPIRVEVSPALSIGLLTSQGRVIREGRGRLTIRSTDPPDAVLGLLIPARAETGGGTLAIHLNTREAHEGLPGWGLPPPGRPAPPPTVMPTRP